MQSNRNMILAIIIGVVIIGAAIILMNRPSDVDLQENEGTQTVEEPEPEPIPEPEPEPTSIKSKVKTLVEKYLTEISSQLSKTDLESIEDTIKDYPVELQPASEAVTVHATEEEEENEYTIDIKTQDWAYAAIGIENTLIGGLVDEQEDKLGLGLYCFLQAAALNPDEPEHLSNVAFHLNNNGDYENSKLLLKYALILDENYYSARSNLAYAYAGQENYTYAILEQLKVVSLRPEKHHFLRLAEYYKKAGLTEASEAVMNAIEGSENVVVAQYPTIIQNLSPNGSSVYEEIERLDEDLYEKISAISDSKMPPLLDLQEKILNDWANLIQWAFWECPAEVAFTGGDSHEICTQCYVPAAQEAFGLISSFHSSAKALLPSFESEAFKELETFTRHAIEKVENADLDELERKALLEEVHRRFTVEYTIRIMAPRKEVQRVWVGIQAEYYAAMAEGCGEFSVEIPEMEEVNYECETLPILCKRWSVWFIVGSASYDPETRNFDLSFGQGVAGKYRYNFARKVSSYGVSLGLNVGKIIQFGIGIFFNPTDGLQSELSAGLNPPIPMYIPDAPTSISISKPILAAAMN